jgi:hypothetical protein
MFVGTGFLAMTWRACLCNLAKVVMNTDIEGKLTFDF